MPTSGSFKFSAFNKLHDRNATMWQRVSAFVSTIVLIREQ